MKICTKCGRELDDSKFYFSNGKALPYCKDCRRKAVKAWRSKNLDKAMAILKRYRNSVKELSKRDDKAKEQYVGGWTITVLNYAKIGEKRYSAINTNGTKFATDDIDRFFNFMDKVVKNG